MSLNAPRGMTEPKMTANAKKKAKALEKELKNKATTKAASITTKRKFRIVRTDMLKARQNFGLAVFGKACLEFTAMKDIADRMKYCFDRMYGPSWHVIVGKDFTMNVRYKKKHFLILTALDKTAEQKPLNLLIFKSPPLPANINALGKGVGIIQSEENISLVKKCNVKLTIHECINFDEVDKCAALASLITIRSKKIVSSEISAAWRSHLIERHGGLWHVISAKSNWLAVSYTTMKVEKNIKTTKKTENDIKQPLALDVELGSHRYVAWCHSQDEIYSGFFTYNHVRFTLYFCSMLAFFLYVISSRGCSKDCTPQKVGELLSNGAICTFESVQENEKCFADSDNIFYFAALCFFAALAIKAFKKLNLTQGHD